MSVFSDPTEMNILTEYDLLNIIYNCGIEDISDIIEKGIENRFINSNQTNLVKSLETTFKMQIDTLGIGDARDSILQIRENIYKDIINILCNKFNLEFIEDNIIANDYYSPAYILYNFLISNFRNYISDFYANFIIKEKKEIYERLNMSQFKKQKDSSTIYNKKTYTNAKLGLLASNISYILKNMSAFEIEYRDVVELTFKYDYNVINYMMNCFTEKGDFYNECYQSIINSNSVNCNPSYIIIDIGNKLNMYGIAKDINFILDNQSVPKEREEFEDGEL